MKFSFRSCTLHSLPIRGFQAAGFRSKPRGLLQLCSFLPPGQSSAQGPLLFSDSLKCLRQVYLAGSSV